MQQQPAVPNVTVVDSPLRPSQYSPSQKSQHYPSQPHLQQNSQHQQGGTGYLPSIPESYSVDLDGAGPQPYPSIAQIPTSHPHSLPQHYSSGTMHLPANQPYQAVQHSGSFVPPDSHGGMPRPPPTPMPPHFAPSMVQPHGPKFMSTLASIPLIGGLFGRKNKQHLRPSQPGPYVDSLYSGHGPQRFNSRPSVPGSSYFTRPSSAMSGYSGHPHQQQHHGSPVNPQNILEKLKGSGRWYITPLVAFMARETLKREVAPLVGRYAMRYPLVEAEESAALKVLAKARENKGVVQSGPMRAMDAREFKHAAKGLNYSSLDQRLENAFVPRFSKLRKYRRAPEVWDDNEAHDIAQGVQARVRGTVGAAGGRLPGEPTLRGGGRGARDREPILGSGASGPYADSYQASSYHENGDHGNVQPMSQPLAYRLAGFLTRLVGPRQTEVRPQSEASYLDHSAADSRRHTSLINPQPRGMSRLPEDDHARVDMPGRANGSGWANDSHVHSGRGGGADDDGDAHSANESELRSLHREPSLDEPAMHHDEKRDGPAAPGNSLGARLRRFFAGPTATANVAANANVVEEYANAAVLNTAVQQPPPPMPEEPLAGDVNPFA
ncbi:hypothetical protein LPJ61_004383, partial [Coemansia biformis]